MLKAFACLPVRELSIVSFVPVLPAPSAVPGLTRSDPRAPGITRVRARGSLGPPAPGGRRGYRRRDAAADPGPGAAAGLDGCVDLAGSGRPYPGHRGGQRGPDPVPVSPAVA